MDEIRIRLRGYKEIVVTEKDLASVTGNIGADVLSTHCVVLLMELASRSAIEGLLPEGKMTVGTQINIRHFGACSLELEPEPSPSLQKSVAEDFFST